MKLTCFLVVLGFTLCVQSLPMTLLRKSTSLKFGDVWSDCSKSGDAAKIDSVTITPDPPKKGQSVTVKATVTTSEVVTNGSAKVEVKFGIIPFYTSTFDLCTILPDVGLKCPVNKGNHTATVTGAVPAEIPSGHYTGNVEVTDENDKELACIKLDLHL